MPRSQVVKKHFETSKSETHKQPHQVELNWFTRLFAKALKMFKKQNFFFYRSEASNYEIQVKAQNASDRNYYFRNF